MDTEGEAPVDLTLRDVDVGAEVTFAMVDATTLPQVGTILKAVSLNDIRLSHGRAAGDARAVERGLGLVGSLGSSHHFREVQTVERVHAVL